MITSMKQYREYIKRLTELYEQVRVRSAQRLPEIVDDLERLSTQAEMDKNYAFQKLLQGRPYGKIRLHIKSLGQYDITQIRVKIREELASLIEAAEVLVANEEKQASKVKLPESVEPKLHTAITEDISGAIFLSGKPLSSTSAMPVQTSSGVSEQSLQETVPTIESLQSQFMQEREARQAIESNFNINLERWRQEYKVLRDRISELEGQQSQYTTALHDREREITDLIQEREHLHQQVRRLSEEIDQLHNVVDRLTAEQKESRWAEEDPIKLAELLMERADIAPASLKQFLQGLGEVVRHVTSIDREWVTANIHAVERFVYTAPEGMGLLAWRGFEETAWIHDLSVLQQTLHRLIAGMGIEILYPEEGAPYRPDLHTCAERDLVVTNRKGVGNGTIHSVLRFGFRDSQTGMVLRKAQVRQYVLAEDTARAVVGRARADSRPTEAELKPFVVEEVQ